MRFAFVRQWMRVDISSFNIMLPDRGQTITQINAD